MRRHRLLAVITIVSLCAPLVDLLPGVTASHAQTKSNKGRFSKLTDALRERLARSDANSHDVARVILNLSDSSNPQPLLQALSQSGVRSSKHLAALGLLVADVPLDKLAETAARDDVSWISDDQEVHSLAVANEVPNPADNTGHVEVTTGAGKVLPTDSTSQTGSGVADGGAGNGIGIAILDSGITPSDNAEFVGYQWKQSSGTLGTGLFSQTYLSTYNRIKKEIDFTG